MLDETQIYILMKRWLQDNNWKILGGEPPGGTNDIPLIELKDVSYTKKGSKGSRKIDFVAYKQGYFLFLELKTIFSYSDIKKLNEVIGETKWHHAFIRTLKEKNIYKELRISTEMEIKYATSDKYYIKAVGFNDTGKLGPQDFVTFLLSDNRVKVIIGTKLKNQIRQLLSM